jgi:hypothetical protein
MELADTTQADLSSVAAFAAHARALSVQQIKARIFQINVERLLSAVRPMLTPSRYDIIFDFFTNHLFMPRDRVARDQAVDDLYEKMKSVTLMDFSNNLRQSVELTQLANDLDDSLVAILRRRNYTCAEAIGPDEVDSAMAEENRHADRLRQVELLTSNFRFFHKLSNTPFARFLLPSMRVFAKATGVSCLVEEIDAGYRAAKSVSDVDAFVNAIWAQESRRLDGLFEAAKAN